MLWLSVAPFVARSAGVMRSALTVAVAVTCAVACGTSDIQDPVVSTPALSAPTGFERRIGVADGGGNQPVSMCLWVADTPQTRSTGMMGASTFGEADAMVFVADAPTTGKFWMWNTSMDLSIAFYNRSGAFLDAFDMTVCNSADPDGCPRYDTPVGYSTAIETAVGDLERLGLVPGSTFTLTDRACSSASSP